MKTNNTDLPPAFKDIAIKLGYQPVRDAKTPTYKKYGVLFKPTNNKLKRFKRVEPIQQEITYFGKRYVTSKAAAKILNHSQKHMHRKLKKFDIKKLDIDGLTYWLKEDVIKAKLGQLAKIDHYAFMDRLNGVKFNIVQTADGQQFTAYNGKITINVNLTVYGQKSKDIINQIPLNEKFLHTPRKNKDDTHYLVGNRGTIINLSLGHLLQPDDVASSGYIVLYINGQSVYLHRLVAYTWLKNLKNKTDLHHINRNKLDDRPSNLVWVTKDQHAKCHNLLKAIDRATDKSSRAAARKDYREYIKQLRRDNSQA